MKKSVLLGTVSLTLALLAGSALAGPTCTRESRDKWIPEADMKQKIAEMGYRDIRTFKTTSGNCYEIYGYDKDGRKAEVYFDPVDARIVKAEVDD